MVILLCRGLFYMEDKKFMYKSRILALVIIFSCLLSLFIVPNMKAEAATVENMTEVEAALSLNKLGMITGNASGDFMLQSKLKRCEAAQFIVNLIGKNKYVKDNKDLYSSTIFKDVKKTDWFAPSVGYCQQVGIVTVNDTFNPSSSVTEKQFLGMVIQALGYTTPNDFSWATVYQKAYEIGLVTDPSYQTKTEDNKEFRRGNVVKIMYTALELKPKSQNMTLLQKLVHEDVITYDTAVSSKILMDEVVTKIAEIKAMNEQKIKIIFNEKIGTVNLENIQINDTANGNALSVSSVSQTNNELILKTSKQTAAKKYSVEIKKLVDFEGNTISKVSGQFSGFTAVEVVSDLFKISKLEQKSANEVNVYFTHPVNENAVNSSYYEVYQNDTLFASANTTDTLIKLLPNNKGITISLRNKSFVVDSEYSIKVYPEVISAYGVNFIAQSELDTFIAKDIKQVSNNIGFDIEQVTAFTRNMIKVDFTMDVNPKIAEQIYMYSLTDQNNKPIEVKSASVVSNPGNSVILTLNGSLDTSKSYNLMVNLMSDASNQYTINTKSYSFTGDVSGGITFQVYSIVPVDTTSMYVSFSKPISEKSIGDLSNFTIVDPKNPSTKLNPNKVVLSAEDLCDVILFFPDDKKLRTDTTYSLRLTSKVTDITGYSLSQTDYSFDTYNISDSKMSIEKAVKISQDTIKVVFSREISTDKPNIDTGNYSVEFNENGVQVKKVPYAITYIDSKVIVLKFDRLPDSTDSTFIYKQIKDIGGVIYSDSQNNTIKVTVAK